MLKPRTGFEAPFAVLDTVNPALVLLSIMGPFVLGLLLSAGGAWTLV
jgi:hypothetical protein